MICLVDYGLGNLSAFITIYKNLGIKAEAVSSVSSLMRASKIILPGVGAFRNAMDELEKIKFLDIIQNIKLQ